MAEIYKGKHEFQCLKCAQEKQQKTFITAKDVRIFVPDLIVKIASLEIDEAFGKKRSLVGKYCITNGCKGQAVLKSD